jgi:hypothetical protein
MRKRYQKGALAVVAVTTLMAAPARSGPPKSDTGQTPSYVAGTIAASRRGRPRKFNRPSRAVTLTLPDDVIATLNEIDSDLSRAVVRAIQPLVPEVPRPPAELTMYGTRAVISVPQNRTLKDRTGVELVPLSAGRALISFDDRLSIPQFELRLRDALADSTLGDDDRATFEAIASILQDARRSDGVDLHQRSIVVLHRTRSGGENVARRRRAGDSEA